MNPELVIKAYLVGRNRGTSLSLGYFISPDGESIFCRNPNSPDGVMVGDTSNIFNSTTFKHFDMSDALSMAETSMPHLSTKQAVIHKDTKGSERFIVKITNRVEIISFRESYESQTQYYHRLLKDNQAIHGGKYYELHQVMGGVVRGKYAEEFLKRVQPLQCVTLGTFEDIQFWWCPNSHKAELQTALEGIPGMMGEFTKFWEHTKYTPNPRSVVFPPSRLV